MSQNVLGDYEGVIARTKVAWEECKNALMRIDEDNLWMHICQKWSAEKWRRGEEKECVFRDGKCTTHNADQFKSFGQYTRIQWGIHRNEAYRKINEALFAEAIDPDRELFPKTERGGSPAAAKLREEIDNMTAEELAKERLETQKKVVDTKQPKVRKLAAAVAWLESTLANGRRIFSNALDEMAIKSGHSIPTLKRAKKFLKNTRGLVCKPERERGKWHWFLPSKTQYIP